jgi:hypothetical protein
MPAARRGHEGAGEGGTNEVAGDPVQHVGVLGGLPDRTRPTDGIGRDAA